jgi:hypothetical protein
MPEFFLQQIFFLASLALLLFFPGLLLLRAFGKESFTPLELFVFSVPTSLAAVNFLMIALGKAGVPLTARNILASLAALGVAAVLADPNLRSRIASISKRKSADEKAEASKENPVRNAFSRQEGLLVVVLFALTVIIKSVYLSQAILPTATDLGHHMYWSKLVAETGRLPEYVERNIVEKDGAYVLDRPEPIDDFIIGEHLVFAAISIISGTGFVSAFPALVLFLANVMGTLAVFLFVLRAAGKDREGDEGPGTAALIALFLLGPLYTLASPQAKFVSGGVVGNVFGNLFIPALLYCYWRAFREHSSRFLTLAFFLTFGLAYIHHLSTLVFLFVACFSAAAFLVLNFAGAKVRFARLARLFASPGPLAFAAAAGLFFFFVLAPSYADPKSVDTALGSPSKATRAGLTFLQLTQSNGEGRMGLGLAGLGLLGLAGWRRFGKKPHETSRGGAFEDGYADAFFFGWGFALLLMSLRPQWLLLDIPSNRISSYSVFPFAVLASLALARLFAGRRTRNGRPGGTETALPRSLATAVFVVLFTLLAVGGFSDNARSLLARGKDQEAVQTFRVSQYLAAKRLPDDLILKDHNYITADSWMKLFFMEGYTYPLSRGYFQRYEDAVNQREQCTLWMIAIPNTPRGEQCFDQTGVNVLVVNPHFDNAQFRKAVAFSLVYVSNDVAAYVRERRE